MSNDVFVPYDELPKPHTGSFLTAKEVELFKDAFKDVARVVRCKDCTMSNIEKVFKNVPESSETVRYCKLIMRYVDDDWFCADGEREVK